MRVYASLLGVLLTIGSAYLAQLAVASAGFERLNGRAAQGGDPGAPGQLWYGGVLDPITVEATRATTPPVAFGTPWTLRGELALSQKAIECARLARPKRSASASDNVHASVGSMM
jgi:hypothetical protein